MLRPGAFRKSMLAIAVLALGLAACSSTSSGASPSPATTGVAQTPGVSTQPPATQSPAPTVASIKDMDICALISAKEVKTIVGFDVAEGKKLKVQSETAGCQWDGAPGHAIQFVTLAVYAFREGAWFPPDANEPNAEMVKGVGDEAYRKEIGLSGSAGDLVVHSGGLIINVTLFNDARKYQTLHPLQVKLATMLISRLK